MTSNIPVPVGLGTVAVSLKDGRVLISGGGTACGDVYSSAALFDPSSKHMVEHGVDGSTGAVSCCHDVPIFANLPEAAPPVVRDGEHDGRLATAEVGEGRRSPVHPWNANRYRVSP
jgi:hypothetical protein